MVNKPIWVEILFKRGAGLNAFRNRFLLDFHRQSIEECIAMENGRPEELRRAAVVAIESDDPATVVQGLSFLLVAGRQPDMQIVEPLTRSANAAVQKAAKTCLFELSHSYEKR